MAAVNPPRLQLGFGDVILHCVRIDASDGADQFAFAIVNLNMRNRIQVELLRHRRLPIDDVDLAQHDPRIGLG